MYYILGLASFILTAFFIKLLHKPAIFIGLVDEPSGRKTHRGNIPLTGGLSIFFSIIVICYLHGDLFGLCYPWYSACLLLITVALLDDLYDLNPIIRLFAQTIATLIMVIWGEVYIIELGDLFGFGNIQLNSFSIPFTLFCVVGVINSINMIDGMDGLAGCIVLGALFFYGILTFFAGLNMLFIFIFSLSCSILVFLYFNMHTPWRYQGKVFLGDTGSMMLGFTLSWISISLSDPRNHLLPPMATVWILGVPLMDTLSIMFRRILKNKSPFSADREHIHHILLRAGFNQSQVVIIIISISLIMGSVGLIGSYINIPSYIMFYAFLSVFSVYNIIIINTRKLSNIICIIRNKLNLI